MRVATDENGVRSEQYLLICPESTYPRPTQNVLDVVDGRIDRGMSPFSLEKDGSEDAFQVPSPVTVIRYSVSSSERIKVKNHVRANGNECLEGLHRAVNRLQAAAQGSVLALPSEVSATFTE
jgi:hypothetical protein